MHIQTAARRAQFITISNPITRFKEPRNYSLSSNNPVSARASSILRRSTGIWGYFEFQNGNSFYMYHVYVCPNENCSVTAPSLFWAVDFHSALLLLTTVSWTITASELKKNLTSPENQDCTCCIWHFLTIGPDDSYNKASHSAESCKPYLPEFSLCVVVSSFQTSD